jgi:peptidoglycan hydrolase CwlO-like protein
MPETVETGFTFVVTEPFNGWWKGDSISHTQLTGEELEWHVEHGLVRVEVNKIDGETPEDEAARLKATFAQLIEQKKAEDAEMLAKAEAERKAADDTAKEKAVKDASAQQTPVATADDKQKKDAKAEKPKGTTDDTTTPQTPAVVTPPPVVPGS